MTETENKLPEFSDGPAMPEMCDATLSHEDVKNLFHDLSECTTIVSVQEKGSEQAYAAAGPVQLELAKQRILSGGVRALQIRYGYQNRDWTDTLMSLPGGIRLIRCQHPEDVTRAVGTAEKL